MVSRKEWYTRVNSGWPKEVPPLTAPEAIRAAKRLYRYAMGNTFAGEVVVTSGRRYTWIRRGTIYVNPETGWESMVHLLSHWFHRHLDFDRPHTSTHAKLELRLIKEVLRRGWLAGTLKDKPKQETPAADPKAAKYRSIVVRMDRWLAKKKRAERALSKLTRQRRYYEGKIGIAA
jgi:hypothetical protein